MKPPPPDPRLLELLPWVQLRAAQLVSRQKWPLTSQEAHAIAGAFLFTYLQQHPQGSANDVAGLAWFRVRGALIDELRTRAGRRQSGSKHGHRWGFDPAEVLEAVAIGLLPETAINSIDSYGHDFEVVAVDPHPDPEALAIEHEEALAAQQLIADSRGCNERDRGILHAYFLEHRSQHDIALELGISEARISQIINSAVHKLRAHYESR